MKEYLKRRVPGPVWNVLKQVCRQLIRGVRWLFEQFGLTVALRSDYYSPLPTVAELKKTQARWHRPSRLKGIRVDLDSFKGRLLRLIREYGDEFSRLAPYRESLKLGFGVGYTEIDAYVLYLMIRDLRPPRYFEVGSGISTYYASLAARANGGSEPMRITCIEPYPYPKLSTIPNCDVIAKPVQEVDLSQFEGLSAGDILFLDSSHILRIDGDIPYLYLEVLPSLKKGVVIHIHDIPFPYNVPHPPKQWVYADEKDSLFWPVYWNEAMILQALLCGNPDFEILLSVPMIRHADETVLREAIPFYRGIEEDPMTFSSIWIRKVG